MEVCTYCGEPKGERIGCCGENHWEAMPDCPQCGSDNVGRLDSNTYECGDCKHDWPENEVLATVVFGSAGPNAFAE